MSSGLNKGLVCWTIDRECRSGTGPIFDYSYLPSTGFQIWPLPMLFLNSLRKNICKDLCSCKVEEMWNSIFCTGQSGCLMFHLCEMSNFTCLRLSQKYYFTNYLEITLAGAKFWTLCCGPYVPPFQWSVFSSEGPDVIRRIVP